MWDWAGVPLAVAVDVVVKSECKPKSNTNTYTDS